MNAKKSIGIAVFAAGMLFASAPASAKDCGKASRKNFDQSCTCSGGTVAYSGKATNVNRDLNGACNHVIRGLRRKVKKSNGRIITEKLLKKTPSIQGRYAKCHITMRFTFKKTRTSKIIKVTENKIRTVTGKGSVKTVNTRSRAKGKAALHAAAKRDCKKYGYLVSVNSTPLRYHSKKKGSSESITTTGVWNCKVKYYVKKKIYFCRP